MKAQPGQEAPPPERADVTGKVMVLRRGCWAEDAVIDHNTAKRKKKKKMNGR